MPETCIFQRRKVSNALIFPWASRPTLNRNCDKLPRSRRFAAEKVTQLFWSRLKDRRGLVILSPSEPARVAVKSSHETSKATPEAGQLSWQRSSSRRRTDGAGLGLPRTIRKPYGSESSRDSRL